MTLSVHFHVVTMYNPDAQNSTTDSGVSLCDLEI
jgi:hypothetical protein